MYPSCRVQIDWQFRPYLDWRVGGTNWSIDYPRSDRRLTRIDAKSVEQRINLDDDDKCVRALFCGVYRRQGMASCRPGDDI